MARFSVVGQAGTSPNYNNLVHVCSVLKYIRFLGDASVAFSPADAAAADWAARYFALTTPGEEPVPVVPGAECAEVLLRAFAPGSWPAIAPGPREVIAMGVSSASLQGSVHTRALLFYSGSADHLTGTNILAPLPREVIKAGRSLVPARAVVFLGHDPLGRAAGIAAAIASGTYSASVVSFPASVEFWRDVASASVLVAGAGVPHLIGAALGIPTLLVTSTVAEDASITGLVPLAFGGWEYLGYLGSLTDNQVRNPTRDLLSSSAPDSVKRLAMSAHGLVRGQEQGVRRIAEWIVREFIGTVSKVSPLQTYPLWPSIPSAPEGRV